VSEAPQFQVVVNDPPMLRAMLLCAQDPEIAAEISRAYYGCLEGRKASPFVMLSVLQSAIGNATLTELAALRKESESFQAEVLKAIRERVGEETKTTPWETPKAPDRPVSTESKTGRQPSWRTASIAVAIAAALISFGFGVCWMQLHSALDDKLIHERQLADERVQRVINEKPENLRVFLDFVSMGGTMERGPIKPSPGISEKEGFAMSSTGGRLSKPWISADDAAIIPIK
jgi:hypothetical protein